MRSPLVAFALAACGSPCPEEGLDAGATTLVESGPLSFTRHTLDAGACGAAWAVPADLDGDGQDELVVSRYRKGSGLKLPVGDVTAYRAGGDLGDWSRQTLLPVGSGAMFPGHLTPGDVDGDGDLDGVVGNGWFVCGRVPFSEPCGGLWWLEQGEDGAFTPHALVEPVQEDFFHGTLLHDLDGDGWQDLLVVAERWGGGDDLGAAEVLLFPGGGGGAPFSSAPHRLAEGLGTLPRLADVDADGDMDLISAQFFLHDGVSWAWLEQVEAPTGPEDPGRWERHVIHDGFGGAIDIQLVPDLFGDGVARAVATNHTNTTDDPEDPASVVLVLTPGEDPREPWAAQVVSEGITARSGAGSLAPGVLGTGDIDGDGDVDLLVSGDGDDRVFWFEQTTPGSFAQHVLEEGLGQAGGVLVRDLDGDGAAELVLTAYEDDLLLLYERTSAAP